MKKLLQFYSFMWLGTIPTTIGEMTALQSLALDENYLSGSIPTVLTFLTRLESLTLSQACITGINYRMSLGRNSNVLIVM